MVQKRFENGLANKRQSEVNPSDPNANLCDGYELLKSMYQRLAERFSCISRNW